MFFITVEGKGEIFPFTFSIRHHFVYRVEIVIGGLSARFNKVNIGRWAGLSNKAPFEEGIYKLIYNILVKKIFFMVMVMSFSIFIK